jgi:hypothetical protein
MNIVEVPKTNSECIEQLKTLGCDLSLPDLELYAAKDVIPKSASKDAESWWPAETVPEAVAASKLLADKQINSERVAEIRELGRHIEKIIVAEDIQKALSEDARVQEFTANSQHTAIRLGDWLQCKWRALEQLDLIRESDRSSRRPEPHWHM